MTRSVIDPAASQSLYRLIWQLPVAVCQVPPAATQVCFVVYCEPIGGLADGAPLGVEGADPVVDPSVVEPAPVPTPGPLEPVDVPLPGAASGDPAEPGVPVPEAPPVAPAPAAPELAPAPLPAPAPPPVCAAARAGAKPMTVTRNAKNSCFMRPPYFGAIKFKRAKTRPGTGGIREARHRSSN
jgi:hypothetical protein